MVRARPQRLGSGIKGVPERAGHWCTTMPTAAELAAIITEANIHLADLVKQQTDVKATEDREAREANVSIE